MGSGGGMARDTCSYYLLEVSRPGNGGQGNCNVDTASG